MTKQSSLRLPNSKQRIAIVGRTGSGKTQAALWHLSNQNLNEIPWVIINHKNDASVDAIKRGRDIDFSVVPQAPGVYRLHPSPNQDEEVNEYLWKLWDKEDVGIYLDEGYMIRNSEGFNACLTQGRSKHIPMITLTQRPVRVSPFVFSECDFMQVFHLFTKRDRQTIEDNSPINMALHLPEYHSWYYDVSKNKTTHLGPVPSIEVIHANIESKLPERQRNWL